MNWFFNGWNSKDRGAVTSIYDVVIDRLCDLRYGIQTCGFEKLKTSSFTRFNYRATPYRQLRKLFVSYAFKQHDHLVDFGCGKGRVYLYAALKGCPEATGIEYDPQMAEIALKNQQHLCNRISKKTKVLHQDAKLTEITDSMNLFFLFIPFHVKTFGHILRNIKTSIERCPRTVTIIFYRPDPPWLEFMRDDSIFVHQFVMKSMNDIMFVLFTNNSKPPFEKNCEEKRLEDMLSGI